jgi:cytochrome c2
MRPLLLAVFLSAVQFGFLSASLQARPLTGEQLYDVACRACHSLGTAPDHRVGPPRGGLLSRINSQRPLALQDGSGVCPHCLPG